MKLISHRRNAPDGVIMDNFLLTQDLYNAIIAENNKFKEYRNTHSEEVEEICRKFSEKFVDMSKERPTSD